MTVQEAIRFLRETEAGCKFTRDEQLLNVCDVAVEALEKQIPKNPILKAMDEFDVDVAAELTCPFCGSPIVNVWSKAEYKPRYCHYCGQSLKWGGDEE